MLEADDPAWSAFEEFKKGRPGEIDASDRVCEYCRSCNVHLIDGNWTCVACNTVLYRYIDSSAEWRYYGADDARGADPTRCCPPTNDLIPTLGCIVGRKARYRRGTAGSTTSFASAKDSGSVAQRYQMWNSLTYRERTLCSVFDVLSANAAQFGLPSCILEEAKALYKRVSEAKISRGENRNAIIACSLFMACKRNGVPRSVKEIASMFNVRGSAMTKACRTFQQLVFVDAAASSASDFVPRFCSRLCMDDKATAMVKRIVSMTDSGSIMTESTPPAVVAGAIQFVCGELDISISKKAISDACLVSPVTINKSFKRLIEQKDAILSARR